MSDKGLGLGGQSVQTATVSIAAAAEARNGPAPNGLRGNIGTLSLLFSVMAFNAPLGTVVGFIPIAIGLGNGAGSPLLYLLGGVIMGLFSVGFIKMSGHVPNSGGFYSYISMGLGRVVGLGASFLALAAYPVQLLGSILFGGVSLQLLVENVFHGPHIEWWIYALASVAAVGTLGYFRLELSAKVLTIALAAELFLVLVYDAVVIVSGGASGLDIRPAFDPTQVLSGSFGIGLLVAVMAMGGFEATVVFREEVRRPERTIPRATYLFIGTISVLFAFTCWVMVQSVGSANAHEYFGADPVGGMMATAETYMGRVSVDVITVLLNTSILAASLSLQNISSRYVYNLGADGILPRALASVHRLHGSPHRASITVSVVTIIGVISCVTFQGDPNFLYAQLIGGFGYAFLVLLLIATAAISVFLMRHHPGDTTLWHRLIAPVLAFAGLGIVVYFATTNLEILFAGTAVARVFVIAVYALIVVGIITALVLKQKRPEVYARIGRQ